jgi:hypothetical protein
MPNPRRLRPPFSLEIKGKKIVATFLSKALADDFARFEFYSRVLHSMKPDSNHVWQASDRLDVEIRGWVKWISWKRVSEVKFSGVPDPKKESSLDNYIPFLHQAMVGSLIGGRGADGKPIYTFEIGNGLQWLGYSFNS